MTVESEILRLLELHLLMDAQSLVEHLRRLNPGRRPIPSKQIVAAIRSMLRSRAIHSFEIQTATGHRLFFAHSALATTLAPVLIQPLAA